MPAYFDGSPITIDPQMPATADQAVLVVRDASGAEVQRRPIPVSDDAFQWSGTESDGSPMAEGVYSFAVETFAGGDLLQSDTPEIYARITEAQTRNGQVMLIMPGGQSIASSDITALREPATASAI